MKYAVIATGGKQYKVSEGDILDVESLGQNEGAYAFENVLLVVEDGKITIGKPTVEGIIVSSSIVGAKRGEKIRVAKFKAKARYRRVTGHRQALTTVKIESIGAKESKKTVKKIK